MTGSWVERGSHDMQGTEIDGEMVVQRPLPRSRGPYELDVRSALQYMSLKGGETHRKAELSLIPGTARLSKNHRYRASPPSSLALRYNHARPSAADPVFCTDPVMYSNARLAE